MSQLCFDLEEENESNNSGVKGRAESICVGSSEWEVSDFGGVLLP